MSADFTRRLGPLVALATALLCLAPAAIPLGAVTRTAADAALARASAAAVRGVVIAVTTRLDPAVDTLYTHVQLAVTRAWGVDAAPGSIALKLLGGADAERALVVGGQARFTPGEDVLVFLDVRPRDGTLSVTGLERGKWTMDGGVSAVASRHLHDAPAAVARDVVPARDLESLAALAGTTVRLPAATLVAPAAFDGPATPAAGDVAPVSAAVAAATALGPPRSTAAYVVALLRAAAAAAQDERDEMRVWLEEARAISTRLALIAAAPAVPIGIDLAEGELWHGVDDYELAEAAFTRALGAAETPAAWRGLARARDRPDAARRRSDSSVVRRARTR